MSIAQRMQQLFDRTEGCRALVLGDLDTGTVLRACAAPDQRQEHHDALIAEAALLFDPDLETLVQQAAGWPGPPLHATRLQAGEAHVFALDPGEGIEVVCARLAPSGPIDRLHSDLAALHDRDA